MYFSLLIWMLMTLVGCRQDTSINASEIKNACMSFMNLSNGYCECFSIFASENLNNKELAFLLASMQHDFEKTDSLRKDMEFEEINNASKLLINGTSECSK